MVLLTLIWLLVPTGQPQAQGAEYLLSPQDKIRIRVVDWQAGKGEYRDWGVVGGEYVIDMSGKIQLPLIGEIPAAGQSTAQLAEGLADAIQTRVGLINRPSAAVEVTEFRPVYVVGEVEKPGAYAYRPGLTVLQAVGLAGGLHRTTESGLLRLERDRITAQGAAATLQLDLRRAYARRARIQAELAGREAIETPPELRADEGLRDLIAAEAAIKAARSEALRIERVALRELKHLLDQEVKSLEQKIQVQLKQVDLARRELQSVGGLVQKGLAVSSREFSLERTVAEIESRLLDLQTAALRAKQEINRTDQKELSLESERKAKLVVELQAVEIDVEQGTAKLNTALRLMDEALVSAPLLALDLRRQAEAPPVYTVVRKSDTGPVEVEVDETSALLAGDLVRVTLSKGVGAPVAHSNIGIRRGEAARSSAEGGLQPDPTYPVVAGSAPAATKRLP